MNIFCHGRLGQRLDLGGPTKLIRISTEQFQMSVYPHEIFLWAETRFSSFYWRYMSQIFGEDSSNQWASKLSLFSLSLWRYSFPTYRCNRPCFLKPYIQKKLWYIKATIVFIFLFWSSYFTFIFKYSCFVVFFD